MEPKAGFTLNRVWADSESDVTQKTSRDLRRVASAVATLPTAEMPDSAFLKAPGTPGVQTVPSQTGSLAQRAIEESKRCICENKAVAILNRMQENGPHQERGRSIAIVLDKPLAEAQALVDDPNAFIREITKIMQDKHAHPVIAQMIHLRSAQLAHQKAKGAVRERRILHSRKLDSNKSLPPTWDSHG